MPFVMQFIALTVVVALLWFYVKWSHSYWARKNVPYVEPSLIWGNMQNPVTTKYGLLYAIKKLYDEFKKRGHIHGGMYMLNTRAYVPVNTELIKRILTKDFQYFAGRGLTVDEKNEPLTAHLFNLDGDQWRNIRVKLTPTFTSGKMKMMFNTVLDCGIPMLEYIDNNLSKNQGDLDIKEILACYSTDIIGSCAFGLECNSFKDPDAEFRKHGRKVLQPTAYYALMRFIGLVLPSLKILLGIRGSPPEVETFFIEAFRNVMDYRKANNVLRNDFVQLLMEINKNGNAKESLTFKQMAAQAFVFFFAGFETSSATMTFCLHELAYNQDIQEKLRDEVRENMSKNDGKLTYDGVMEMKYLDQVVNETLRKYPPVGALTRICTMDYKVPDTDVTIDAGTRVLISTFAIHRDEEYYPDSEKFDPERFTEENKAKRPAYAFLPFGEGPRICIGLRFGLMQTKTGLAMILNNYRILPVAGEPYNIHFDPKSIILTKEGNVMLKAEKLSI